MTKLEAELILFGYMRCNRKKPDKYTASVLVPDKSWRTVCGYLRELQVCIGSDWMQKDGFEMGEIIEMDPERERLYRMVFLLGEVMDSADKGVFSPEYLRLSDVLVPPQISIDNVWESYSFYLDVDLPKREIQRDVRLCKKMIRLIQEQNGREEDWEIDDW